MSRDASKPGLSFMPPILPMNGSRTPNVWGTRVEWMSAGGHYLTDYIIKDGEIANLEFNAKCSSWHTSKLSRSHSYLEFISLKSCWLMSRSGVDSRWNLHWISANLGNQIIYFGHERLICEWMKVERTGVGLEVKNILLLSLGNDSWGPLGRFWWWQVASC